MTIEPVSSNYLNTQLKPIEAMKAPETSFVEWIGQQMVSTNEQLNSADKALEDLASGHSENLHHTMLTLEQAKLSFQYLEQIRNRLMSAYQELLREQI